MGYLDTLRAGVALSYSVEMLSNKGVIGLRNQRLQVTKPLMTEIINGDGGGDCKVRKFGTADFDVVLYYRTYEGVLTFTLFKDLEELKEFAEESGNGAFLTKIANIQENDLSDDDEF